MFQPDSLLIRFLTRVCDLIFLNMIFLLSCMTIVCSGTAVTALYSITLKMIQKKDYAPIKGFLRSLRENFIPAVPAAVLLFIAIALFAFLREALYAEVLLISPVLFIMLCIAAVFLTALLSWLFPLLACFDNSFSGHLQNAGRLALANLPVTFLLTLVNLWPLLLSMCFPQLTGVVFAFLLLIGFAAGAYVNAFYLNRIFEQYR